MIRFTNDRNYYFAYTQACKYESKQLYYSIILARIEPIEYVIRNESNENT